MSDAIVTIDSSNWKLEQVDPSWIEALEDGKVLFFPNLSFALDDNEKTFLTPNTLSPKSRNVSLNANLQLKGAQGSPEQLELLNQMIARYRELAA